MTSSNLHKQYLAIQCFIKIPSKKHCWIMQWKYWQKQSNSRFPYTDTHFFTFGKTFTKIGSSESLSTQYWRWPTEYKSDGAGSWPAYINLMMRYIVPLCSTLYQMVLFIFVTVIPRYFNSAKFSFDYFLQIIFCILMTINKHSLHLIRVYLTLTSILQCNRISFFSIYGID